MKTLLAAILLSASLLFSSTDCLAQQRVVMTFTDSRGNSGGTVSFPSILDVGRTDFVVCNKYKNGRTTTSGLAEFDAAMLQCKATGTVTDVVFMLGVNDMIIAGGATSSQMVASQLLDLADMARSYGAREWIVEEYPGPRLWGGWLDARKWTRENIEWLHTLSGGLYNIVPRPESTVFQWKKFNTSDPGCSSDDLHPNAYSTCITSTANSLMEVIP